MIKDEKNKPQNKNAIYIPGGKKAEEFRANIMNPAATYPNRKPGTYSKDNPPAPPKSEKPHKPAGTSPRQMELERLTAVVTKNEVKHNTKKLAERKNGNKDIIIGQHREKPYPHRKPGTHNKQDNPPPPPNSGKPHKPAGKLPRQVELERLTEFATNEAKQYATKLQGQKNGNKDIIIGKDKDLENNRLQNKIKEKASKAKNYISEKGAKLKGQISSFAKNARNKSNNKNYTRLP